MGHVRYLSYVVRHKWFVLVAGIRVGAPLWRLLIHDWTKFSPSEWVAYVRYFYGNADTKESIHLYHGDPRHDRMRRPYKEQVEAAFDVAWLHHQRRNKHHWQYWVLIHDTPEASGPSRCLPMPWQYAREMVADWMGAGRAITGKWECVKWYHANRNNIQLHPDTRRVVEHLLANHHPRSGRE